MKVTVSRLHTFTGHNEGVYTLQQADQPHLFFSGSADGLVVLWNLQSPDDGELIAKLPNSVYALHLHQASKYLVAGNNYQGIHILDWKNKREIGSLRFTQSAIFDIQSVDSNLYIGDKNGMLTVVNMDSLKVVDSLKVSDKSIRAIAIHPLSGELALGCSDNFIRVIDRSSLEIRTEWKAHVNSVFTVRYTPDGHYLLSGSRDARLKLWDVRGGYHLITEVVAHMNTINHLDFSPDYKHFVTCSLDKSIKLWDLGAMRLLKVIDKARHGGHGTSVNKLLWTSHQAQLVSASDDRTISVWNIEVNNNGLDS